MAEGNGGDQTTRRAILAGALGAAAAVAASAVRPAVTASADGDPVLVGDDHFGTDTTLVQTSGVDKTGLMGRSTAASGIGLDGWADGTDSAGGRFVATSATGVTFGAIGRNHSPAGIGVYARNVAGGVGLSVEGKATFKRSGKATVDAGKSTKVVTLSGVTSSSIIIGTMAANRSGRWVRAIVPAANQFTIYLNTSVGSATKVSWMVLDPYVQH